jgi:glycosyltransferase involved in cell wall biosynthesis
LFVRDFALELVRRNHFVVVQPVARKRGYEPDPGLVIAPLPWRGGDQELASMRFGSPRTWFVFSDLLARGIRAVCETSRRHAIDRMLAMWVVPSGLLAYAAHGFTGVPYDVWALGSDIWRVGRIPLAGPALIRRVARGAGRCFADGHELLRDVERLTGVDCEFLPATRRLPEPRSGARTLSPRDRTHLLYVGRYHRNKGPDLLLSAIGCLRPEVRSRIALHMFGTGPMETQLRRRIEVEGLADCVKLGGPIGAQELADFLTQCAFLVIPSRIESIPVVLSDALQCGVPVVAMPVGDLPRLIGEYRCGVAAREVTPAALAHGIEEALARSRATFADGVGRAGRALSLESAVDRWLELCFATT